MGIIKNLLYRIRGDYTTEKLISMGMKVGKNFGRLNGVILDPSHCWLIEIGDNVTIAPRAHILCHDASTKTILGYSKIGRVKIGDNVFIGAESVILPGVTIGNNVIVGAGSVVTKSIPSGCVVAGNPAKVIMSYDDYTRKNDNLLNNRPVYGEEYTLRNKQLSNYQKEEMIQALSDGGFGFVE